MGFQEIDVEMMYLFQKIISYLAELAQRYIKHLQILHKYVSVRFVRGKC